MPLGGRLLIENRNVTLSEGPANGNPDAVHGDFVMMAVTDSGCGMPPEVAARVFEPFFTTKEQGKGTGLGLSTVYGIVAQTGGHVTIESKENVGTTVRVYLPKIDAPQLAVDASARPYVAHGTETVLVVEDEPEVRMLVRGILQTFGYNVIVASNGYEGVQMADEYNGTIHLLVSDIVMPEMGGYALARRLKKHRPDIKVLYMSGYTDQTILQDALSDPTAAFIQKPVGPDVLARCVREVLDGKVTRN
jgi:CheY-like chemotaxis protein